MAVVLKLRNQPQLKNFLSALQDPADPNYHHFLTPQQFTAQYGPTQAQVNAVRQYLEAQGLSVTRVTPNHLAIYAKAPGGTLEQAFGIRLNDYRYQGRNVYGPAEKPRLPADLAARVGSILGLNNIIRTRSMSIGGVQPAEAYQCLDLNGDPVPQKVYTPQQFRTAYDWPTLADTNYGAGATIAIAAADSSNFSMNDLNTFWDNHGLPHHSVTLVTVASGTNDGVSESEEDAEWAGTMAPGANLVIYRGDGGVQGLFTVYAQIVQDNQAQVLTTSFSYTETPSALSAGHPIFAQAAAQGITVVAASGDDGGVPYYPSTDPLVTSAGGTSLVLNSDNTIQNERVWNDDWGATGGAVSALFSRPSWQYGPGVPGDNSFRDTNDISLDADPCTGYPAIGPLGSLHVGGTSLVAPQIAALFADFISLSGNARLGQANPALYEDARTHYAADFHDITQGFNSASQYATPNWDYPTGWGTLDVTQLLNHFDGGIALAPPLHGAAEFLRCVNRQAQYLLDWQSGPIGTAGSYQLDQQTSSSTWVNVYNGTGTTQGLYLPAGTVHLRLRGRSNSPQFWTRYTDWSFQVPSCGGGGGGQSKTADSGS